MIDFVTNTDRKKKNKNKKKQNKKQKQKQKRAYLRYYPGFLHAVGEIEGALVRIHH
jgi:hypothetical protein